MVTVALCRDAAGMSETRIDERDAHLAHLKAHAADLLLAAPLVAPGRDREIAGSLFILAGDDIAAARSIVEKDPYHSAGVWSQCDFHATESRFGMWMPEHADQLAMFAPLAPGGRIDPPDPADRHFLFLCRERSDETLPQALQMEHGAFIAGLFKRMMVGLRLLPGASDRDAPHGLYIYRAADLTAAQALAKAEPYVREGRWGIELFVMPALLGSWPRAGRAS